MYFAFARKSKRKFHPVSCLVLILVIRIEEKTHQAFSSVRVMILIVIYCIVLQTAFRGYKTIRLKPVLLGHIGQFYDFYFNILRNCL